MLFEFHALLKQTINIPGESCKLPRPPLAEHRMLRHKSVRHLPLRQRLPAFSCQNNPDERDKKGTRAREREREREKERNPFRIPRRRANSLGFTRPRPPMTGGGVFINARRCIPLISIANNRWPSSRKTLLT